MRAAVKLLVLAMLPVLLSACVLQSAVPVFTEDQAKLVLGSTATAMQSYSWKNGAWAAEEDPLTLSVEGQHYIAKDKDSAVSLAFVPLHGNWFAVQAVEARKAAVYTLAVVENRTAILHVLSCSDLKKRTALDPYVEYKDDDCFIKAGASAMALFVELIKAPGEPSMKLEPAG